MVLFLKNLKCPTSSMTNCFLTFESFLFNNNLSCESDMECSVEEFLIFSIEFGEVLFDFVATSLNLASNLDQKSRLKDDLITSKLIKRSGLIIFLLKSKSLNKNNLKAFII